MAKLRVENFTISLDGYSAGPNQSLENPVGEGGEELQTWLFRTAAFRRVHGQRGGITGTDNDFAERGYTNIGSWIIGRNMFGPFRGPWPEEKWKGWWGSRPPFQCPVFILTDHPHLPIALEGGTTFFFVTEGIRSAIERAKIAARGRDIRIGGGAETIRRFLLEHYIDELHLAFVPIILGSGTSFFSGINFSKLGYRCVGQTATPHATHVIIKRI